MQLKNNRMSIVASTELSSLSGTVLSGSLLLFTEHQKFASRGGREGRCGLIFALGGDAHEISTLPLSVAPRFVPAWSLSTRTQERDSQEKDWNTRFYNYKQTPLQTSSPSSILSKAVCVVVVLKLAFKRGYLLWSHMCGATHVPFLCGKNPK